MALVSVMLATRILSKEIGRNSDLKLTGSSASLMAIKNIENKVIPPKNVNTIFSLATGYHFKFILRLIMIIFYKCKVHRINIMSQKIAHAL
ncbi:MAG: hypothetical protein YK1309IOTA_1780002 [Marine Group I thaumarchaeote]|nr:MAG: hypothetical protein YK1309IOTA_1780002 [Marine Group I thaumarchaeote]